MGLEPIPTYPIQVLSEQGFRLLLCKEGLSGMNAVMRVESPFMHCFDHVTINDRNRVLNVHYFGRVYINGINKIYRT